MPNTPKQTLQARLDRESKEIIVEAAALRHVGLSDYIRLVLVPEARREVEQSKHKTIRMTATEQETFWEALENPRKPTAAQKRLAKIMRGEA